MLLAAGYRRRLEAGRKRSDRALFQPLEIAEVDAMTGREFEFYIADLFCGRCNVPVKRVAECIRRYDFRYTVSHSVIISGYQAIAAPARHRTA